MHIRAWVDLLGCLGHDVGTRTSRKLPAIAKTTKQVALIGRIYLMNHFSQSTHVCDVVDPRTGRRRYQVAREQIMTLGDLPLIIAFVQRTHLARYLRQVSY
jgi:hypothetical protein